jgi:hypothetical protein
MWSGEDIHLPAWCFIPEDRTLFFSLFVCLFYEREYADIMSYKQFIWCDGAEFKNSHAILRNRLFIWC